MRTIIKKILVGEETYSYKTLAEFFNDHRSEGTIFLIWRLSDSQEITYKDHEPGSKRVHIAYPIRRNQGKYVLQKNLRALFHWYLSRRTCLLELSKQQLCFDGLRWYRIRLEHQLKANLKEQGSQKEEGPERTGKEEGEVEGKGSYTERSHIATVKRRPSYRTG